MQNSTTLKMFGTGQVTIPKKWRNRIKTDKFVAIINDDDEIVLRPIDANWKTLFNADRDGGPIDARELLIALKKDIKKHGQNRKISK